MAPVWKPWTVAILYLLDDDEWHEWTEAVTVGARCVPPGKAYRHGEELRSRPDKRANPGPRMRGDEADAIFAGSRSFARNVLNGLIRNGHIERNKTVETDTPTRSKLWVRITDKGRKALNEIEAAQP